MAKRKAAKKAVKPSGRPLQFCEKCGKGTKTRAGKCVEMRDGKECGYVKETKPTKPKTKPNQSESIDLKSAAKLVKEMGGLDELRKQIADLRAAQKTLDSFGGVEAAESVATTLKDIADLMKPEADSAE